MIKSPSQQGGSMGSSSQKPGMRLLKKEPVNNIWNLGKRGESV